MHDKSADMGATPPQIIMIVTQMDLQYTSWSVGNI